MPLLGMGRARHASERVGLASTTSRNGFQGVVVVRTLSLKENKITSVRHWPCFLADVTRTGVAKHGELAAKVFIFVHYSV